MNVRLETVALLVLTLIGFALRLFYATTSHPFFDEYTTVLAARQILRYGWPVLPSGLFYEHGLLATYLITPFTALFINTPLTNWQPAHWGLMLSRWPSVLLGAATIPLIYAVGRRSLAVSRRRDRSISLLAAGLFALSPEGMVWGGRARMYALATLLVLLTVYWAYQGALLPPRPKYRWWALLALQALLLTQFGALLLVPPLLVGMLVINGLAQLEKTQIQEGPQQPRPTPYALRTIKSWKSFPTFLFEGIALFAVVTLSILVKRLGRPLGVASLEASNLSGTSENNLLIELLNTVTYQTALHFTWADTTKFLARQFGVSHHFWLVIITLSGILIGFIFWMGKKRSEPSPKFLTIPPSFNLFLWLIFGLIILEMVTLLAPFRRNPRYLVMFLPLFYLIAAHAVFEWLTFLRKMICGLVPSLQGFFAARNSQLVASLMTLTGFTFIAAGDLRIALITPEPAYEQAFAFVQAEWQPDDVLLTMNTPAAALYLNQMHGFTIQNDAYQFLLDQEPTPVDRWAGAPWIGDAAGFNAALNRSPRAWFVIDTIRQPVYFQGDWLTLLNQQMEPVWAKDNALIYRTRPDRMPLPDQPDRLVNAAWSDVVRLVGYSFQTVIPGAQAPDQISERFGVDSTGANLRLVLFWQALRPMLIDYTVFLHLRNSEGQTVAQRDGMPVDGAYPTSRWQLGETIIDPLELSLPPDLPAGDYALVIGLYRLDTLERLPVTDDTSGENAVVLGEMSLP